ncbi:hypothetical protein [Streptomyces sp. CB03238]|uniref:hypothetical protein n=1 Tax=Streptomyces sp. CB03238 TaxID=1907777 RepID=UPI00117C127F|nr:hypothetical protein [Streptomyces sp. CB03238]
MQHVLADEQKALADEWLHAGFRETLSALEAGQEAGLSVEHHGSVVSWAGRPAIFLRLAHRKPDTPDCAFQVEEGLER